MWQLIIGGLMLGLVGGPFVFFALGNLVVKLKTRNNEKRIQKMRQEHNKQLKKIQKEYEKNKKSFHKLDLKIQRVIAKAKEQEI